ncbi:MAG: lipoyl(octanoyl) transferase LipB [Geminicoccaceae bacterium]|nr:lipoyl(octanoyl) transferase LipB [Geminicoccaceae bacterium]
MARHLAQGAELGKTVTHAPEWRVERRLVPYPEAVDAMEARVAAIRAGTAPELVWLLEHPPLYTAGTSADPGELLDPDRFPVFKTGRGGRFTYHGPGQRVAYVLLDLDRRGRDLKRHVWRLEEWVIATLARLGLEARRAPGRIGVWVEGADRREAKIAAIGVRVRHWVTFHGLALNVCPDLEHFSGIVPCGLAAYPVTSLAALGIEASMERIDELLAATFGQVFDDPPIAAYDPAPTRLRSTRFAPS